MFQRSVQQKEYVFIISLFGQGRGKADQVTKVRWKKNFSIPVDRVNADLYLTSSSFGQNFFKLRRHRIAHLARAGFPADIPRPHALVDRSSHRFLHRFCFREEVQRVLEQHGRGKDSGNGVHDPLAGDVGC